MNEMMTEIQSKRRVRGHVFLVYGICEEMVFAACLGLNWGWIAEKERSPEKPSVSIFFPAF